MCDYETGVRFSIFDKIYHSGKKGVVDEEMIPKLSPNDRYHVFIALGKMTPLQYIEDRIEHGNMFRNKEGRVTLTNCGKGVYRYLKEETKDAQRVGLYS